MPVTPSVGFYAASQVPGLALPITAAEALSASCFVSVTASGLMMAAANPILPAHAFIRVASPIGASVYVQVDGLLNGLSGLITGASYFLDTPGQLTAVAPSVSGISQRVGTAVAGDTLLVQIEPPVYL